MGGCCAELVLCVWVCVCFGSARPPLSLVFDDAIGKDECATPDSGSFSQILCLHHLIHNVSWRRTGSPRVPRCAVSLTVQASAVAKSHVFIPLSHGNTFSLCASFARNKQGGGAGQSTCAIVRQTQRGRRPVTRRHLLQVRKSVTPYYLLQTWEYQKWPVHPLPLTAWQMWRMKARMSGW